METLSGIKAHTLRIWEKRYSIITPKRTPTNIRYYTDEDLRNLLNVAFLNKQGIKISKIAKMDAGEIISTVSDYTKLTLNADDQIETLLLFIFQLDCYNLDKIFDEYISQIGLERTMMELIYPLLERLSMAWLTGSFKGAHESFVTQKIKLKIHACTQALENRTDFSPKFLIYLPIGEKQELSLMYMHFLLKKNKAKVINLGGDVSMMDVIEAVEIAKPEYIFTIINNEIGNNSFQNYIDEIASSMEEATLVVTGYLPVAKKINWPEKTIVLKDLSKTIEFITSLSN